MTKAILFTMFGLGLLSGCANQAGATHITLRKNDEAATYLIAYLRCANVVVDKGEFVVVSNSQYARDTIARYLAKTRERMTIIAVNIANINTTRDAEGKINPYRRKMVVPDEKGLMKTIIDQSPFRRKHRPGHPDANADGYVFYPNIALETEMVEMICATRAYELAIQVLQRLEPSLVGISAEDPENYRRINGNRQ